MNRSDAEIIRELAGMHNESVTDAAVLTLHIQHLTAGGMRADTIRARRGVVTRLADWLDPYAEHPRAVLDATPQRLVEWQAHYAGLAAASIRAYVMQIQQFYAWCIRPARLLTESPAADLIVPQVRRRRPRPIPETDLDFAFTACTDRRILAWLVLGAYAGCRSIDIAGLDRDDLLTRAEIPFLRIRGKGDNEDLVAVGHEVLDVLDPFMHRKGALFVDSDGRRLLARYVRETINDYLRRIGLPFTFHQFRHRFGTRVYELTKDIRFTQTQMRHRSVASTELYVAVPTDAALRSVKALDAELSNRSIGRRRADLGA